MQKPNAASKKAKRVRIAATIKATIGRLTSKNNTTKVQKTNPMRAAKIFGPALIFPLLRWKVLTIHSAVNAIGLYAPRPNPLSAKSIPKKKTNQKEGIIK